MKRSTFWLLVIGGLLLLTGGGVAVYAMTRGLRLNNPGNVFYNAANKWEGEIVPSQDAELTQFSTMEYGIRAIGHILDSYVARGLTTVDSIIRTYSKTDQDAYVQNVSSDLGVSPTDVIAIDDPATKFAFVRAIIKQEQGVLPAATISDATVQTGLGLV